MPRKLTPEKLAMLARRQEIGRRYLRGETQAAIATAVGIGQGAVSRHLAALRAEWRQTAAGSVADKLARELARIAQVERAAWAALDEINADEARPAEQAPAADTAAKSKRLPAAKALERIAWAVEQRCKLFGLYAPAKVAPTTPDGSQPYRQWDSESLAAFARSLSDSELNTLRGLRGKIPTGVTFSLGQDAAGLAAFGRALSEAEVATLAAIQTKLPAGMGLPLN